MPKAEKILIEEARQGKPIIRQLMKQGNSLVVILTGYGQEGDYFSVIKKNDLIILKKMNTSIDTTDIDT